MYILRYLVIAIVAEIVGIYSSFRQYGNSIRIITEDIKEFFKN